ncbi:MAG: hypothetical protein DHS20C17_33230 [Cyclobacteriaceae bacterium]|nr:MAG: hypothetical protein DHS20C17_33230 [Cyclobacteriaceae bacterium]
MITKFSSALLLITLMVGCIDSKKNGTHSKIRQTVDSIQLVDTHEHLIPEKMRLSTTTDFFHLFKDYIRNDLLSSGMGKDIEQYILNAENPLDSRWTKFAPYWQKTRNTTYARNIMLAAKDLFEVEDINENTYRLLNQKMLESNKPGWYNYVLKEKAGIEVALLDPLAYGYPQDSTIQIQKEFFVRVKRFSDFISIDKDRIRKIEQNTNSVLNELDDLLNVLDIEIEKVAKNHEIVALKSGHAYSRAIRYEDVTHAEAENVFNKMINSPQQIEFRDETKLQDFIMLHLMRKAEYYNLPFQIHTGILAGTSHQNNISNTNAIHLSNLFPKFPQLKFIIFHGSYPYMAELGVLAKTHPNVYIDMSWMYVISPEASRSALKEWLLTVPSNKIMAFGGDYGQTVEATYAHAVMARRIVTEVLIEMVDKEYLNEQDAIYLAKRILRENALEIYNLEKKEGYYARGE